MTQKILIEFGLVTASYWEWFYKTVAACFSAAPATHSGGRWALATILLLTGTSIFVLRRWAWQFTNSKTCSGHVGWHKGLEAVSQPIQLSVGILGCYAAFSPLLIKNSGSTPTVLLAHSASIAEGLLLISTGWFFLRASHFLREYIKNWSQLQEEGWNRVAGLFAAKVLRGVIPVLLLIAAIQTIPLPPEWVVAAQKTTALLTIGLLTWTLIQIVMGLDEVVLLKHQGLDTGTVAGRKIHTQLHVLQKIGYFLITLFSVSSVLMLFDNVRQLGASLLASAGVAGIIIGFSAQRALGNLLAGLQIAITQPIRLGDQIVVEKEWGKVEEITLTYVVVAIWDQRRLILPISQFIEKPFENWTRHSSEILGGISLHVDFATPIEEIRCEALRLAQNHPLWDGRTCNLQVVNATEKTLELRILVSASDAGNLWNLRCDLREKLLLFLQSQKPCSIPRHRIQTL